MAYTGSSASVRIANIKTMAHQNLHDPDSNDQEELSTEEMKDAAGGAASTKDKPSFSELSKISLNATSKNLSNKNKTEFGSFEPR